MTIYYKLRSRVDNRDETNKFRKSTINMNHFIYCAFTDLPDFARASMMEVEYPGKPRF